MTKDTRIVVQMVDFPSCSRSKPFGGKLSDICGMLRKQTPEEMIDRHRVLVIFSDYDDPDAELSMEFPLTVRQFLHVYGSYDEPEVKLDG